MIGLSKMNERFYDKMLLDGCVLTKIFFKKTQQASNSN